MKALVWAFVLCMSLPDVGQACEKQGRISYTDEIASRDLASLTDVPVGVREKALSTLRARLGKALFGRAEFAGGKQIDLERPARRAEPQLAYRLRFRVDVGSACTVALDLDRDGALVKPLAFPDVAAHPEKARVLTLAHILEHSLAESFDLEIVSEDLVYHAATDSLAWSFHWSVYGGGSSGFRVNLLVSAYTGRVLGVETNFLVVD